MGDVVWQYSINPTGEPRRAVLPEAKVPTVTDDIAYVTNYCSIYAVD
ncbi:hypothetical protein [Haladaptatus halobius]|nr:hypothetical protein [Haladaptatus halobius]